MRPMLSSFNHILRWLLPPLVILALGYCGILLYLYSIQDEMMFQPTRELYATPADVELAFEDVNFVTNDRVNLHGWFITNPAARGTLLFMHGNAGNMSDRLQSILQFYRLGFAVFIFDYRGYGQSEGEPDEEGTYADTRAAWNYLTETRGIAPQRIVLFGRSLGAANAAWLSRDVPARALIMESAFVSAAQVGSDHYPFLPIRLLLRYGYNNESYVQERTMPLLLIHSVEDEVVSIEHARALQALAHAPASLLEIRGGHNNGFLVSEPDYSRGIAAFLNTLPRN